MAEAAAIRPPSSIANEIEGLGRTFIDVFDTLELHLEEEDYVVRQDMIDSAPVIVTKCKAPGLTAEHVQRLCDDPTGVAAAMNDKMTCTYVADDADGNKIHHFYVETPTMVSNRSMFVTYFIRKSENGEVLILAGSTGNDRFNESHVDLVQGGEQGELKISYQRFIPIEGGYNVEQVSCFDAKGWLPGFVQKLGVSRQAYLVRYQINYLMTGEKPPPVF